MKTQRMFLILLIQLIAVSGFAQEDENASEKRIPITFQKQPPQPSDTIREGSEERITIAEDELLELPVEEPQEEEEIFLIVQVMPEFPGGERALFAYLDSNVVYPDSLAEAGVGGMVFVQFVVRSTGEVDPEEVRILRGVHPLLDAEAVRVIRAMPNWTPGRQRDQPVSVYMRFPVRFGSKKP